MIKKEIFIGFLVGVFANLAGIYLYIAAFSPDSFELTLQKAIKNDYMGSIIALGAIANFLPFFVFLKKQQTYRSRGVVIATIVAAIAIAYFKFV